MKVAALSHHFPLLLFLLVRGITSQGCGTGPESMYYPNCTQANTAFCEGGTGSTIIFRCFYPYGHACPGNCMDNLDEKYRDAACWESAPGVGDGQCAAECVSVTAKNGSNFYPFGCERASGSSSVTLPMSTTTSIPTTTTTQASSPTTSPKSGSIRRVDSSEVAFWMGCMFSLAGFIAQ